LEEKIEGHEVAEQKDKDRLEYHKAFCEYLRFLITLSTGSLVLLTTFLERFTQPEWKVSVGIALGGFATSVVTAVVAYTVAVLHLGKDMGNSAILFGLGLFLTWICFLIGIVSLAGFALVNLS
jgi:hypothetical protein